MVPPANVVLDVGMGLGSGSKDTGSTTMLASALVSPGCPGSMLALGLLSPFLTADSLLLLSGLETIADDGGSGVI